MSDIICIILLVFMIGVVKQLDRIERRLEVITPAYEMVGYTYNYDVKEYCTEEGVKDSLKVR